MQHEPSRLLTDAHVFGDLATAHTVLTVEDHPHCDEPFVERDRGVLHDGSDFDGELAFGMVLGTLPSAPLGVETDPIRSATGTNHATIGPSPQSQVINAVMEFRSTERPLEGSLVQASYPAWGCSPCFKM